MTPAGKARCLDNILAERLWRSVKYEDVCLYGCRDIPEAREGLRSYFMFYNYQRFHQSRDNKTPWQVFTQNQEVSPRIRQAALQAVLERFFPQPRVQTADRNSRSMTNWLHLKMGRKWS